MRRIVLILHAAELGAAKIGLAVSGGADSMALAALAAEALGPDRVIGLVVDHKLGHMGTSENPAQVQTMLSSIGTISWRVNVPTQLDDRARSQV